jgi:hypothetical protein
MELIGDVPAEPAPPEVRDEVLDRVDLLWSMLGPPEWTAAVLGQSPPDVPTETSAATDTAAATSDTDAAAPAEPSESTEPTEPVEIAAPVEAAAPVEGSQGEVADREYDAYNEVESLVPPPPRLRRSGFPRSMYPGRRRVVRAAVIALAAVFVAAIVADFRGFGRDTRSFAAEAKAAAREEPTATTTPATTAPPVTTAVPGPDTRPPFVYNLATVFGCIGPQQTTTSALASVVDPGDHLATVELVYVDTASPGAETRKRMTASGGAFEAPIGPYAADGTITWRVVATDEAGNSSTGEGPSVAASATC